MSSRNRPHRVLGGTLGKFRQYFADKPCTAPMQRTEDGRDRKSDFDVRLTTRPRRPEIDGRSIDVASANSRRVVRPFGRCCRKCSFHSVIVKTICFGNREMGLLASFYLSEEGDNIDRRELQVYALPTCDLFNLSMSHQRLR